VLLNKSQINKVTLCH